MSHLLAIETDVRIRQTGQSVYSVVLAGFMDYEDWWDMGEGSGLSHRMIHVWAFCLVPK